MGVEEIIRSKTTKEEGLAFVDSNGKRIAEFPVDHESGASFTCDIEILRGELNQIFYDKSLEEKGMVEYVFGDHMTDLEHKDNGKVLVTFAKGEMREFDIVVGADGMGSKVRRLAFPNEDSLKGLGQYMAFFTIPYRESDGSFGTWYNAPGGRCIFLRPDGTGATRTYLSIMSSSPAGYYKLSIQEQKKMMRELFTDAGWEAARVLEGMDTADDFYMQEIAQVKMSSWSSGHITLLGDAGYCPSPISGMGTSLAIIGAYVLAGEIAEQFNRQKDGHASLEKALEGYEKQMRPYVTKAQSLPPGAPAIVNPQTWWGIKILNTIVGFVGWSGIATLVGKWSGLPAEDKSLPEYVF